MLVMVQHLTLSSRCRPTQRLRRRSVSVISQQGKEAQFDVELTAQDLGDLKIHGLASGDLELKSEASKTIRVAAAKTRSSVEWTAA